MSEATKVQMLAFQIATTFVDDAAALIGGCGRIIVQILMSPVERLANACDVAGVLANRRFSHAVKGRSEPHRAQRRHWLLGSLGDLT
jgi:hypothetical protein